MAPRAPKNNAGSFPGWDELVAEAASQATVSEPYRLPLPPDPDAPPEAMEEGEAPNPDRNVVLIEMPDGDRYLNLVAAQGRGDSLACLVHLFPSDTDRQRVRRALKGAPWPMVDLLTSKVLRHFYGLPVKDLGKPDGS